MSDTSGFGIVPRYLRGTLTAYEVALYVALSWRADENGISWAGQATLAQDAGMSRSTVQRSLDSLEAKGLVKSKPWANAKGRTSNIYALRIWTEPVLSQGTIKRQDGHPMEGGTTPDQAEHIPDVPSQGTSDVQIQTQVVPSQGTSLPSQGITPVEEGGVRLTDANPRVSQTQRKKTHKNENQEDKTLGQRMTESRERGEPVAPFLAEIEESLGYLPPLSALVKAEKQWTWAHGGWRSVEIVRDYVMHCRKQGWVPTDEGWWSAMEYEDRRRAKAPRKMYGPDGVPQ